MRERDIDVIEDYTETEDTEISGIEIIEDSDESETINSSSSCHYFCLKNGITCSVEVECDKLSIDIKTPTGSQCIVVQ